MNGTKGVKNCNYGIADLHPHHFCGLYNIHAIHGAHSQLLWTVLTHVVRAVLTDLHENLPRIGQFISDARVKCRSTHLFVQDFPWRPINAACILNENAARLCEAANVCVSPASGLCRDWDWAYTSCGRKRLERFSISSPNDRELTHASIRCKSPCTTPFDHYSARFWFQLAFRDIGSLILGVKLR